MKRDDIQHNGDGEYHQNEQNEWICMGRNEKKKGNCAP